MALLFVLVPLLAYKQYEWLGQVSVSQREQMQKNMEQTSVQLVNDIEREIGRVGDGFNVGVLSGDTAAAREQNLKRDFVKLYTRWQRTSSNARLVNGLYLILDRGGERPELSRLNPLTSEFEVTEWPPELKHLSVTQRSTVTTIGVVKSAMIRLRSPVDLKIPGVIVNLMDTVQEEPFGLMKQSVGQAVVTLNMDYIRKDLLPALARQHLASADGVMTYSAMVIDKTAPARVIYSNTGASDAGGKFDVAKEIFGGPLELHSVSTNVPDIISSITDIKQSKTQNFSFKVEKSSVGGAVSVFQSSSKGGWQLALTHRAGSLDAAVEQTRERNLAISFGVLLLLTLSMAMIVITSQRERRLARQQMEFVSAVSHELRTPLAVICSAGENLADGVVRDEERTRQYGNLVRNEGRRLAEMVEQVLDFAGIQSGRKAYRFEPSDVSEIVDRALEMFELQIRDTGIVIEKRIADELPPVLADRPSLIRALQNLVGNALKYGQAGNWISIRADKVNDTVRLSVADRGQGIASADLPHVFEPFYRGRCAVDAQIKGSGLGLALVKQIVEAHNGKIGVESTSGAGTTFTMTLPIVNALPDAIGSHDQAYSPR